MLNPTINFADGLAVPTAPLAFGFVAPGFAAAGILLAGIPIVIHILNRRRFKVVPWAAMDFLLRALRKNRRRLRFEQWLLLATRCALLLLLGLALSRPLGCNNSSLAGLAGRSSGIDVIVIDNAGPMAYEADRPGAKTHLDQAKLIAHALVDRLAGGQSVAIITAARPASAIIAPPTYDLKAAEAAIDRIEQSYDRPDLDTALQKAIEIGTDLSREPDKTLYILTDSTRATWQSPQADVIKQKLKQLSSIYTTGITHFDLGRPGQSNAAITDLQHDGKLVTEFFGTQFKAVGRSFGAPEDVQVSWRLDGQPLAGGGAAHLDLEPKNLQQANVPLSGGVHLLSAALDPPDHLQADDVRYEVVHAEPTVKILIVEGERNPGPLGGSGAFLNLALAPDQPAGSAATSRPSSYVSSDVISDLELSSKVLGDYRAVIFCGVGQVSDGEAEQLKHFVERGGTLMFFMGDAVSADNYNATLYSRHLMPGPLVKRISVDTDQKGFSFDFQPDGVIHPVLHDFAHVQNSGLDTAQIFSYWQVELAPSSHVEHVLDYRIASNGSAPAVAAGHAAGADPAITLHSLGRGQVLFFSTSADAAWTSLPAKPAYVTLMHALLLGTVNSDEAWMNLSVGDAVELPPTFRATEPPIMADPDGKIVVMDLDSGTYRSGPLKAPGVYTLRCGEITVPIAVNVPATDDADLRTLDAAALHKAMGDIPVQLQGDSLPSRAESADAMDTGKDFEWGLMIAALLLTGAECYLAMRFGHYRRPTVKLAAE